MVMPLDEALLAQLPSELSVEVDGKPTPLRETSFVKEAKDFPTFVRGAYDAHREVGARIPIKHDGKPESIAEWRKTHLPNIYKAGLLDAPPASPDDYGVVKPEGVPAGLQWDDDRAKRYAGILHKHGVPKAIVPELMALHVEALAGTVTALKTSKEEGIKALKAEFGDNYDIRVEDAKRLTNAIFKSPEELAFFENTGIGDHPGFLSVLMRLAPLASQDSSILAGTPASGGGAATGDAVRSEVADIMNNTANPKHKLYHSRDKATMDYIDALYKKAYGGGQIELSGGGIR
jgi:hypothetical protein